MVVVWQGAPAPRAARRAPLPLMRYLAKAASEDRRPRTWGVPRPGPAERGGAPASPGQPHRRCIPSAGPLSGARRRFTRHHRDGGGGLGAVTCSDTCTASLSDTMPHAGQRSMNGKDPAVVARRHQVLAQLGQPWGSGQRGLLAHGPDPTSRPRRGPGRWRLHMVCESWRAPGGRALDRRRPDFARRSSSLARSVLWHSASARAKARRHSQRRRDARQNRGARIRTGDLADPNGARYQAAPRPEVRSV